MVLKQCAEYANYFLYVTVSDIKNEISMQAKTQRSRSEVPWKIVVCKKEIE